MNFFSRANKMVIKFFEFITGTDQQKMLVDVSMLRTNWIFRSREDSQGEHQNFDAFIETLAQSDSDQMYSTQFMIMIVDEFWSLYQTSIFCTCFLPFVIYCYSTLRLFSISYTKDPNDIEDDDQWKVTLNEFIVVLLTLYFLIFEVKQMNDRKWRYLGQL